jgi:cardiolipin synthase
MKDNKHKEAWASRLTINQILSIPNILSFVRIALIPIIIWAYCTLGNYLLTIALIAFSGITDIIDGFIARRFNMVTDFGKALDPIADKLTQGAIMICLLTRFPLMWLLLILLAVKEISSFILRLILFTRTEAVYGSHWHGKLATIMIYATVALHIIWATIPPTFSGALIVITSAVMFFSFAMYTAEGLKYLKK